MKGWRRWVLVVGVYLSLGAVLAVYVFPVYWTVVSSLKPLAELTSRTPSLLPRRITWAHYSEVLAASLFARFFWNSVVVAAGATALTALLASLSGYALSRVRFWGQRLVARLILLVYLFPGILLVVPLYQMMTSIGLYNTRTSLMIIHVLFALPFSVWTLKVFFDQVPADLEDAARIDGCSRLGVLWRIYLPLVRPAVATIAIFTFVVSWNEYMFSVVLLADSHLQTLPVGLAAWTSTYAINWGHVAAASVMTMVPVVVLFGLMGSMFVHGLTGGAVKG